MALTRDEANKEVQLPRQTMKRTKTEHWLGDRDQTQSWGQLGWELMTQSQSRRRCLTTRTRIEHRMGIEHKVQDNCKEHRRRQGWEWSERIYIGIKCGLPKHAYIFAYDNTKSVQRVLTCHRDFSEPRVKWENVRRDKMRITKACTFLHTESVQWILTCYQYFFELRLKQGLIGMKS